MTFKEFFDKYSRLLIALVAILSGLGAGEITEAFKDYEHLNWIHAAMAALTIVLGYLLVQSQRLPEIAKRLGQHSEELEELKSSYAKMVTLNEAAVKAQQASEADRKQAAKDRKELMQILHKVNERLGYLEGRINGHVGH